MNKAQKKKLKTRYKQNEQGKIRASMPMSVDEIKELLSYLDRESVSECDHTLNETLKFIGSKPLDQDVIVGWLGEHGGYCDCEVLANVYDAVGDIVDWHLDESINK